MFFFHPQTVPGPRRSPRVAEGAGPHRGLGVERQRRRADRPPGRQRVPHRGPGRVPGLPNHV